MKKNILICCSMAILMAACSSPMPALPTPTQPRATTSPIPPTATQIPPTATFTPTPTLVLPVGQLTPVPSSNEIISVGNAKGLEEVARYYGDVSYSAKLTADSKFLFILDPDGITKYDYESMVPITNVALANSASDLQVSNNGNWAIIDNNWLLDFGSGKEPKQYELPSLLDFHPQIFVLSPDGSMIAAQRYACPSSCNHELLIISTKDFSIIHTDRGPTLQNVFAFSPDGTYYAVVDRAAHEDRNGNAVIDGSEASIWSTTDFRKVSNIPVRFPFRVSSIAISKDNKKLAVSQLEFIDIFDLPNGDSKTTIGNLCLSYGRKILFTPSSRPQLLEQSECKSASPDFSRIAFDEKGYSKTIPYPHPSESTLRPYGSIDYFRFLDESTISFKSSDSRSSARHSCDLSLAEGSFACEAHEPNTDGAQITGEDRILATDGKYYDVIVNDSKVDIFSDADPAQTYYSMPFQNYQFDVRALDTINNVIFYNLHLDTNANRVIVRDMSSDHVLQKWEGETYLASVVFSGNGKYAAFCRLKGYNTRPNKDKLTILDLSKKTVIYDETFTCSGVSLALNHDGNVLAVEHNYLKNPTDRRYSVRLLTFNTQLPYDKKYIELEAASRAIAWSPDDSLLAVACHESDICFFDVVTNNQVHQIKAHSEITNIAFSPDGKFLATSSNWGLISVWAILPFSN